MSNDNDFEAAAAVIGERAGLLSDPQLVITIEKWLTRLTGEDRGTNELYYLKLLQYMMVNKLVGRPFVSAPPTGPLPPLSRYLIPPRSCPPNRPARGGGGGGVGCWRTHYSSRSAQTTTDDGGDDNEESAADADNGGGGTDAANATSTDNATVASASAASAPASSATVASVSAPASASTSASTVPAASSGSRGGHLAGGGECRSLTHRGGSTKPEAEKATGPMNPFVTLCNPCLDGFGRHLRKARPMPLDEAYRELLGECALPSLTDRERESVGPEMLRVLESVDDDTALQDFYFQVSLHTCDQGALLVRSSESMVNDFEALASDVFEVRAEHISYGLAREQMALGDKYAYLRDRELNRATVALDYLRSACPLFNWHKYRADPDACMKRLVLAAASSGDDAAVASSNDVDDEDEARRQSAAVKKLLYSLNWLRTEAVRAGAEERRLTDCRSDMHAQLARLNDRLTADRDRAAADFGRLKCELTALRRREDEQTARIDRRLETIQLLGHNNKQLVATADASC